MLHHTNTLSMVKSLIKRTKDLFSRRDNKINDNDEEEEKVEERNDTLLKKSSSDDNDDDIAPIIIVGAGIVGLVLALALDRHCGVKVELYEQANAFHDDVGAGMGMYPNGLRVIRDISPQLLKDIQAAGYPYLLRRYERHDGTEVAKADETKLVGPDGETEEDADDLQPIGLRRWKLQKILYQAVVDAGMPIHFNKQLESVEQRTEESRRTSVRLQFTDGTIRTTRLLLAADGSKSRVRTLVSGGKYRLTHTGTTCLMGTANVARHERGLCLPSSETTRCHGAFYPTGENEQCFQFHFPTSIQEAIKEGSIDPIDFSWGGLTHSVEQEECNKLADKLVLDGWDEKFIQPLRHVHKALKIGFSTLEPQLDSFVFGRVVLVGDSAHPPVPYLGQGAQQGLEDAGTLALLLQHFCKKGSRGDGFSLENIASALTLYNSLRQPRTAEILNRGKLWGQQQQKRAENPKYNKMREEHIRREVFYHETLPILLPAVRHDYREEVRSAIQQAKDKNVLAEGAGHHLPSVTNNIGSGGNADHSHLLPVPEETTCY